MLRVGWVGAQVPWQGVQGVGQMGKRLQRDSRQAMVQKVRSMWARSWRPWGVGGRDRVPFLKLEPARSKSGGMLVGSLLPAPEPLA